MFESPPEWTIPIANLTQWFDWEALGAIGTVGALWAALIQIFRNARFDRLRAASTLTRLGELLGPISELSPYDEDRRLVPEHFRQLSEGGLIDRAIRGLEAISVEHVPDTTIANYVQALPLVLESYKTAITRPEAGTYPPFYDDHARYVDEANEYVGLLTDLYLRGSWRARRTLMKKFWSTPK